MSCVWLLPSLRKVVDLTHLKTAWQEEGGWKGLCEDFQDYHCEKPQPLSFARARACTDEAIKGFFDKLGGIYARLNLLVKPMQVFNCDEMGISIVHNPGHILTEMGRKKYVSYVW
jgi:hypothetical protein